MRKTVLKPLLSILAAGAAISCAKEAKTLGEYSASGTYSGKFVNTKAGADHSSILFKATDNMADDFAVEGLKDIHKLFVSVPGREEIEAEYGLDRWYEASVEGSIDQVSQALAALPQVALVEFNTRIYTEAEPCGAPAGKEVSSVRSASETAVFNDKYLDLQWGLINTGDKSVSTTAYAGADINVKDVWTKMTTGDPDIVIAICDEGVKYTHPDLKDNMWTNTAELNGVEGVDDDLNGYVDDIYGANFTGQGGGVICWNKHAHGTHCAGIAAAVNNNGTGICGVAGGSGKGDGCRIMSCQIMYGGTGSVAPAAKGIKYAADNGASVISCSFGYSAGAFSTDNEYIRYAGAEYDALRYFEGDGGAGNNPVVDGGIAIFASGNDGAAYACYPGALADVISVSAFGPDFLPTYYTNYGPGCNIAAPGGEAYHLPWTTYKGMILSTVPNELESQTLEGKTSKTDYGYMQGTSMACPFVSGVTALALSYAKKLGKTFDQKEFKEMIVTSANDMDSYINKVGTKTLYGQTVDLKTYLHQMGTGSIDAWVLMTKMEGIPSLVATIGSNNALSIDSYFGTSSKVLTYLSVEISDEDKKELGLTEDPYMKYGKLWIHPTKPGSVKVKVTAVGGGDALGGGNNPTGGMEVSQEVSVVARYLKAANGGWM